MNNQKYTPMNRYLHVQRRPRPVNDLEQTVLLPDGYHKPESRYETVEVLDVAPNCAFLDRVSPGSSIVVLSNFLEDVDVDGQTYTVVLENHVMGILNQPE